MAEEKVTEEQVNEALQQLTFPDGNESETSKSQESEPETEPSAEETQPAETATEEVSEESAVEEEPQTAAEDDVASLQARLEEAEKQAEARLEAQKQRYAQNEQILRDRFLRKSNATASALKILKAARSEQGVSQEEADRVIREMEGTMHPSSASYVAPEPTAAAANEEQALVLNAFLNDQGMTQDEANEFGNWIRAEGGTKMTAMEQAVANQSLDGFLRIAHGRWQEGMREKEKETRQDDARGAVRSVKRTQTAAAKAASTKPTAPRKQPASPKKDTVDVDKLTNDDISALLRQTVTDNR